jgi:hypothetical protein
MTDCRRIFGLWLTKITLCSRENPRHPSLQLKKVGRFWSVRVGLNYRALAVVASDGLLWFWIGSHAEYIEKIKSEHP